MSRVRTTAPFVPFVDLRARYETIRAGIDEALHEVPSDSGGEG